MRASAVVASAPPIHQPANVSAASTSTTGTNTAETRSASRAIGALLPCASDGERAAVDLLFGLLYPPVVGYATKFLGDATVAEDVAQDALVKLFGRLHQYDRERDALTWALTVTTWECRTARRRIHRRAETGDAVSASIDGARLAEGRELVHAALATLESLPARDREVIAASLTTTTSSRRASRRRRSASASSARSSACALPGCPAMARSDALDRARRAYERSHVLAGRIAT